MLVKRKISELRVSELRSELEKRKLDNKGLKSTLLQRLQKVIIYGFIKKTTNLNLKVFCVVCSVYLHFW